MTTPGDQADTLRSAIERQQAARDAARDVSREIAREREAERVPAESTSEE